jgi:hypothetical protein
MGAGLGGRVARTVVSVLLVGVALAVGTLFVVVGTLALLGTAQSIAWLVVIVVTLAELGFVAAATIFAISVTLGYSYALTDNLVVPTVVHSVNDATLFGLAYVALGTGLL